MSRTQLGRSALALSLALVAALAALLGLAWFVMRGPTAPSSSATLRPEIETTQPTSVADPARSSPSGVREAERAAQPKALVGPPPIVTTTLRLRVLDETTRAPIPELGFVVSRERGRSVVLARGKTRADGRAEVAGLEEDTLTLRTERKPPHAAASASCVLLASNPQELEILVGAGGTITGRVVDDRKAPVAGAALYLAELPTLFDPPEALARSGPDGRFRIECATSPTPVTALANGISGCVSAAPKPGEETDVGDIELARTSSYSGRVVDPDERPVAGALVSLRKNRLVASQRRPQGAQDELLRRAPGEAGFQVLSAEVLTDAAGHFELSADGHSASVVVWTPAGALQEFKLPPLEPGARKDELVLKLDARTRVELELVDADGAPAPVPAPRLSSSGIWAPWGISGVFGEGRVSLLARAGGVTIAWDSTAVAGADGIWRLQPRVDAARIEELQIAASGYETLVEKPAAGFPVPLRLRRTLTPFPTLRVRLLPADRTAKLLPAPGAPLELHVCMADPLHHANAALGFCCGFGVFWRGDWRGESLPLVLPVKRKAPFWVHARARGADGVQHDVANFGPFDPGTEEHELVLDPALFDAGQEDLAHPARLGLGPNEIVRTRLTARIENAKTGKTIPNAALLLVEVVAAPHKPRAQRVDADAAGLIERVPVRSGRFSVRASVRGYARSEIVERNFPEGETLDLGTLALDPLPAHEGRLLDAKGEAPGKVWMIFVDAGGKEPDPARSTECMPDGHFTFYGELPEKLLLHVERQPTRAGEPLESQRFALPLWPVNETKELRLAPSRRVVLVLSGASPDDQPLFPSVCPALDEPTGLCDHRLTLLSWHLPLETAVPLEPIPGSQRCALRLAPGRYQIYGQNLLRVLPLSEITIPEGDGDFELTLGVQ